MGDIWSIYINSLFIRMCESINERQDLNTILTSNCKVILGQSPIKPRNQAVFLR